MSQAGANGSVPVYDIVETLQGNTGAKVFPDATHNIHVVGDGTTCTVAGNPATHTLTISVVGEGETWHTISASQALVGNNGYICIAPGGALSLSLPAASVVGSIIEVTLAGATSFTITQGANQQITRGSTSTTLGVGGSIASNAQGDGLRMVCTKANLLWQTLPGVQGTFTIT